MQVPGGIEAIQEATRACYEHWHEYRRLHGAEPPAWETLSQRTQAQWTAAVIVSLEVGTIAMIFDFIAWARTQGDLSGGISTAMMKYAREELGYERAATPNEEGEGHG